MDGKAASVGAGGSVAWRQWLTPIVAGAVPTVLLWAVPWLFGADHARTWGMLLALAAGFLVTVMSVLALARWVWCRGVGRRGDRLLRLLALPPASAMVTSALLSWWQGAVNDGLPPGSWSERFDAGTWQDPRSVDDPTPTPRQRMLGHLVRAVLPGRTRAEVLALLGPPTRPSPRGWPPDAPAADGDEWIVGMERGWISIDGEWLVVRFDTSGRCVDSRVRTD